MPIATATAVERILAARADRRALAPFSTTDGTLTIDQAYTIQDALAAELRHRGHAHVGWKLAATGPTGQAQLGVTAPVYGPLRSAVFASGDTVSHGAFVHLGTEAEIAFQLGTDLAGPGVTPQTAMQAVAYLRPALELPDMTFAGKFHFTDLVADCAASAAIVLGAPFTPPPGFDLAQEQVTFWRNGSLRGTNIAAELMGHPMNALAWLANQMGARGHRLKAGDIVMSGGLSSFIHPQPGDSVEVRFNHIGTVNITVAA